MEKSSVVGVEPRGGGGGGVRGEERHMAELTLTKFRSSLMLGVPQEHGGGV